MYNELLNSQQPESDYSGYLSSQSSTRSPGISSVSESKDRVGGGGVLSKRGRDSQQSKEKYADDLVCQYLVSCAPS